MTTEPDPERLAALEARIDALKGQRTRKPKRTGSGFSQGEVAWRMVLELATGMALGLAIGYGIDTLTGTKPLFLVIFSLFGFAAGVKTMLGSAKQLQASQAAQEAAGQEAAKAARIQVQAAKAADDEGE
ncbi:AtpZ/AtpI family protein [Stagnihabitans tardus]|uniref:ATP synthase protein I n=1 Tax=Stagnihabitans tardus TaxID=2699202 RepID=A0AAE5BUW8_9RHOB|nr:AtpZ/AtpI family protein [Stagnihabitans tardus]NBZ86568.1 F0F1 ATP synthase subunit I [Stagnihabitans tardus]